MHQWSGEFSLLLLEDLALFLVLGKKSTDDKFCGGDLSGSNIYHTQPLLNQYQHQQTFRIDTHSIPSHLHADIISHQNVHVKINCHAWPVIHSQVYWGQSCLKGNKSTLNGA